MSAVATQGISGKRSSRSYLAQTAGMARGFVVIQGSTDTNAVLSTGNVVPLGIQDESSINVGDVISITRSGEAYGVIGAAVNAGQYVISDAQGRLIPSAAVGDCVVGQALTSGAAANDEIIVDVHPFIR